MSKSSAAVITMPSGMKDPSDLWASDPSVERFRERFQAALDNAVPIDEFIAAKFADNDTNRAESAGDADQWETPTELPGLAPVPAWNDGLLPMALRPWLADVSDRAQCPSEYPAIGTMVALASVIGRGCAIRPKRHDNWTVVPNLWGAIVGPPSAMKTPALKEAMRPLGWLASQASKHHSSLDFERETIEAQLKALKAQMEKLAKKGEDTEGLREQYIELQDERKRLASERRFIVYDSTIEKLGEILYASPRGVLQFRDELMGWLSQLDRQGHEADRAFYLEAWNGDGSFVYDRIGRGTIPIESACVSVLGGIQPGPLGSYLRAAMDGGVGADGLVQRFQLLVYPDQAREWRNVDRPPDAAARERAVALFERLANATPDELGAEVDDDGIAFLRFDEAAQEFFDEWRAELETRLRSGELSSAVESHLAKYRSLMPSLALICHLADQGSGPVGLVSAKRAAAWCDLLEAHAMRVYGSASSGPVSVARLLLAKVKGGKLKAPFTVRDAYRPQWSGLTEPGTVETAINVLEQHGWVRREHVPTGGRPREEIHVHPSLRGE